MASSTSDNIFHKQYFYLMKKHKPSSATLFLKTDALLEEKKNKLQFSFFLISRTFHESNDPLRPRLHSASLNKCQKTANLLLNKLIATN